MLGLALSLELRNQSALTEAIRQTETLLYS